MPTAVPVLCSLVNHLNFIIGSETSVLQCEGGLLTVFCLLFILANPHLFHLEFLYFIVLSS